jgi:beta-glucosidase
MVYCDYQTQKRIIKDSGFWYRDVIKANGENL